MLQKVAVNVWTGIRFGMRIWLEERGLSHVAVAAAASDFKATISLKTLEM